MPIPRNNKTALVRTDIELDKLSTITPSDIERSKAKWASTLLGGLLVSQLIVIQDGKPVKLT